MFSLIEYSHSVVVYLMVIVRTCFSLGGHSISLQALKNASCNSFSRSTVKLPARCPVKVDVIRAMDPDLEVPAILK